jgi:hypothetical protein
MTDRDWRLPGARVNPSCYPTVSMQPLKPLVRGHYLGTADHQSTGVTRDLLRLVAPDDDEYLRFSKAALEQLSFFTLSKIETAGVVQVVIGLCQIVNVTSGDRLRREAVAGPVGVHAEEGWAEPDEIPADQLGMN